MIAEKMALEGTSTRSCGQVKGSTDQIDRFAQVLVDIAVL